MPQINKPTDYFNTVTYTGNGGTQSITGVGFQTDFNWTKCRSTTNNHSLIDVVRGIPETLRCDTTGAETTDTQTITSFDSDGFSMSGTNAKVNTSGQTYVSWNWLAGGTASSNTDGSITSSVSANTTSGFSVVTYTGNGTSGATVGHGLGSTPATIIVKRRDSATAWYVWHQSGGFTDNQFLELSTTNATQTSGGQIWDVSEFSSSVFSLGTGTDVNASGGTFVAYCFAEKKGFSKFGSYTGNGSGSGDGTFVYTGFKPAFVMVKRTNSSLWGWVMIDNKRSTPSGNNLIDKSLLANATDTEYAPGSGWVADFLSNGFKFRMTANHSAVNGNGDPYIYMAFAESPLVGTNNIPATAR